MPPFSELRAVVQRNCLIADARHARDYTMCTYLLKMREYYRWEKGYRFADSLPKDELGSWLSERERLWETLEEEPFAPLPVNGAKFAPFDSAAINQALTPLGLVYSGGYGGHATPHFFLGELLRAEDREGFSILVAGSEQARDLAAPPAMSQGKTIYIRRESLRRLLWERIEEWRWRKAEGPMRRALDHFGFDADPDGALETMTDCELEAAILHEVGECRAGELLGEEWNEMLLTLSATQAELVARAVRDHLADSLCALPSLLERNSAASLHFYFANYRGMRRELYPELLSAYQHWAEDGKTRLLLDTIKRGRDRWQAAAEELLRLYRDHGPAAATPISELLKNKGPATEAPEQPCQCAAKPA
ncbi:MAG: Sfum_1244 family protein [Sulfuricellaceae bacterium]|jgi:hypothetical protein